MNLQPLSSRAYFFAPNAIHNLLFAQKSASVFIDYTTDGAAIRLERTCWWRRRTRIRIDQQGVLVRGERLPVDCKVVVFERTIVFDSRWRQWTVSHREDEEGRALLARLLNEAFERWRARFGLGREQVPDKLGDLLG